MSYPGGGSVWPRLSEPENGLTGTVAAKETGCGAVLSAVGLRVVFATIRSDHLPQRVVDATPVGFVLELPVQVLRDFDARHHQSLPTGSK